MELAKRQAAVARLAVDADLLRRFTAAPASVAAGLGLTVEEADRLAAETDRLDHFARSLVGKRLLAVRGLLPSTAAALGPRFDDEFQRYAASRPTQGPRRHERDALGFARFLSSSLTRAELSALSEESGWIEIRLGRRLVVRRVGPWACRLWLRIGRSARVWRLGRSAPAAAAEPITRESG